MRLGDLDALKKAIEEQRKPKVYSEADERQNIIVDCILYIIDNAPTVEPKTKLVANVTFDKEQMEELVEKAKADILAQIERPQGQGEWIIDQNEKFYHYKCPFCGFWATGDFLSTNSNLDLPNFCEKCGADMRKGGKEE